MKVVKVIYQKVFPLAQYVNEKIGIEIEMNSDTEDENEVYEHAKSTVHRWHKESNPLLSVVETLTMPPRVIQVEGSYNGTGDLATDIKSCKTIDMIDTYRLIVDAKGYEWAKDIYRECRAELVKIESDALISAADIYKVNK